MGEFEECSLANIPVTQVIGARFFNENDKRKVENIN